jgi:hypothetical protein
MRLKPPFAIISLVGALACSGKSTSDSASADAACAAPVAGAGVDQTALLGGPVGLDASASTVCARYTDQATYTWAFVTVPPGSTVDDSAFSDNRSSTARTPTFSPDIPGDYVVSLVVADPEAESAPDFVVVNVVSGDQPPVASCGPEVAGRVGEAATLDGSASYDPEGAALEYSWALSEKPACSGLTSDGIFNGAGPSPTVVPDCDGVYLVSLVVSDGIQFSEPDLCALNVSAGNRLPEADAGETLELGSCAANPLPLNGYGSYDPDGDSVTYQWSLLSAPAGSAVDDASFDSTTSAEPRFAWDVSGTYVFQLQVYDGQVWSAPDLVSITIGDSGSNRPPTANAGTDITVELEADCTYLSYTWDCLDCEATQVELDGSASEDPDGDPLTFSWVEPTGTLSIAVADSALTGALIPAQAAGQGTANTMTLTATLNVADCQGSDEDSVVINYSCTGVRP